MKNIIIFIVALFVLQACSSIKGVKLRTGREEISFTSLSLLQKGMPIDSVEDKIYGYIDFIGSFKDKRTNNEYVYKIYRKNEFTTGFWIFTRNHYNLYVLLYENGNLIMWDELDKFKLNDNPVIKETARIIRKNYLQKL